MAFPRTTSPCTQRPASSAFEANSNVNSHLERLSAIKNRRAHSPEKPVTQERKAAAAEAKTTAPPSHTAIFAPPPAKAKTIAPPAKPKPAAPSVKATAPPEPVTAGTRRGSLPGLYSGDLYQVLGVPKVESPERINKAFKKLSRKYHPDKRANKNDDTVFKTISEAYAVLMDPVRRGMYDNTGFTCEEDIMAGMARDPSIRPKIHRLVNEGKLKLSPVPPSQDMAPPPPAWARHPSPTGPRRAPMHSPMGPRGPMHSPSGRMHSATGPAPQIAWSGMAAHQSLRGARVYQTSGNCVWSSADEQPVGASSTRPNHLQHKVPEPLVGMGGRHSWQC